MPPTFETQVIRPGVAGLNLKAASDAVLPSQLLQMTNVVGTKQEIGELQSRPGQTEFATAGVKVHSIATLADSANVPGNAAVVAGADNNLYSGISGALTLRDTGYSGNPLCLTPYRPEHSPDPWLYIADGTRMRKIRNDGLVLPIGLPPVAAAVTSALAAEKSTTALLFDDPTGWNKFAYNGSTVPGDPVADANPDTGNGLKFTTVPGAATAAYANAWDHAAVADFSFIGGTTPASDSDYISFYLKLSNPEVTNDIRIDFGLGGTGDNFYTKHFRPSDFTQVSISGNQPSIVGEDQVARYQQTDQALDTISDDRVANNIQLRKAQRQQRNTQSLQTVTGADSWTLFGTYGVVLRRGDFLRRGTDESVDWANVQSITVTVFVSDTSAVSVSLSDMKLTGGSGPDTGEFGLSEYDYRVVNVDKRTGAVSNPSPEQTSGINALRRSITVTTIPYGDSEIRQWIYRRGGTLNDNWYFIGENSSDGAAFTDDVSDAQAAEGSLLELDNDQPISTVDALDNTVLAQPVPSLFGPAQDYLFACGDPYRAGTVYYSKPGRPDSWPPQNAVEVCPPSEVLQSGCVYGSEAFVFSTERLYRLLPNTGILGTVTAIPTACSHGLYARQGWVVGKNGIFFVSYDGLYVTQGGPEEFIADDIQPLFNNEIRNGYYPIDFTVPNAIALEIHDNDLWFLYQDTQGVQQCLIYSLLAKYWRHYNFFNAVAGLYSDNTYSRLILGGKATGKLYSHAGVSDDGTAISCTVTIPYLDQESPRQMKTYGDVTVDYAMGETPTTLTITPSFDTGLTTLPPVTITSSSQADL